MEVKNRIKLKVCGMKEAGNISAILSCHPDYIGFIFYDKSPRYVGDSFILGRTLPPVTRGVGVFVDTPVDDIKRRCEENLFKIVQLHGNEGPDDIKELKKGGFEVIKVFSIDDSFDFEATKPFQDFADLFLFDTKGRYRGGNATRWNWEKLEDYDQTVPFLLSGGITAESIKDIKLLKGMNLHGIDVNSGVELSPGIKDERKVQEVFNELKKFSENIYSTGI